MKRLLFMFTFILCAAGAFASQDSPLALFNQANGLYSKGQFNKAADIYESILAQSGVNAALYYNLGNSYYRTQRTGRAVLMYERAARLKPRDSDIRFNLNFMRTLVKEPGEPFPEIMFTALNNLISLNELTVLCSALFFLLIFGIIFYTILKQQGILILNIVLVSLVVVFAGWLVIKINQEVLNHEAIVIAGPADVRNGPGSENSVGFTLPEGRKLMILGAKDDWIAVGLKSEGLKGWIEKKYIEEI